jgi:type I restriction enzyme, S subunit
MDSLIGVVPDGWTDQRIDEICEVLAGPSTVQISSTERGWMDIPVVTPRDLRHNRIVDDCATGVKPETAYELTRYRLLPDDIVCARTGHLGRQAWVSEKQRDWLIGSACLRLRRRQMINTRYLVYYLGHPAVRDWIVRNAGGAVIPTLSTELLGSLPVAVPPPAIQACVADILGALDDKIVVYEQISRTTATLRDAVLLRLLTGADPASLLTSR